jgi:transcriptional regulator with XRE-family HTH domain
MTAPIALGNSLKRRTLAEMLRELRHQSGMSIDTVSVRTGIHVSKLSRLETGITPVKPADLGQLLVFYKAGAGQRQEMQDLLETPPSRVMKQTAVTRADEVLDWSPVILPQLTWTREYAAAVIEVLQPVFMIIPSEVLAGVEAVMKKQARLGSGELRLRAVIGEDALYRPFGSAAVMSGQLDALGRLAASRTAGPDIRVLRRGADAPAVSGPFTYLTFPAESGLDPVVLAARLAGEWRLDQETETYPYSRVFGLLADAAAERGETAELIRAARNYWKTAARH